MKAALFPVKGEHCVSTALQDKLPQDRLCVWMPDLCLEAPYRWRHAALSELKDFLVKERAQGRFHPKCEVGLRPQDL